MNKFMLSQGSSVSSGPERAVGRSVDNATGEGAEVHSCSGATFTNAGGSGEESQPTYTPEISHPSEQECFERSEGIGDEPCIEQLIGSLHFDDLEH